MAFVLFAGSCELLLLEPVDIEAIMESDEIKDYLQNNRVGLIDNTGHGLSPGNTRINGIKEDSYYLVEELDENGTFTGIKVVRSNGRLSDTHSEIGKAATGSILGLNNNNTYSVFSAAPLTGTLGRHDVSSASSIVPSNSGTSTTPSNGTIFLSPPSSFWFLDFRAVLDQQTYDYEIYRVSLPSGVVDPLPVDIHDHPGFPSRVLIRLIEGTFSDYVIIEKDKTFGRIVSFQYIKTDVAGTPPPGDLTITLLEVLADETSKLPSGNITISQASFFVPNATGTNSHIRTITVANTTPPFTGFSWTVNGAIVPGNTTNVLTLNFNEFITSNPGLTAAGTFYVTVTATSAGKPWSARVLVIVTP